MRKVQDILNPWYAVNDDPWLYQPVTARESGADWNAHARGNQSEREMNYQAPLTQRQKHSMAQSSSQQWLIDITMAARKAVHEGQPYSLADTRDWYEHQEAARLKDVFFVYDDWAKGVLQEEDRMGIICWYAFGNIRYTTVDNDDNDKPVLTEKQLLVPHFEKPELKDNSEALQNVLVQLANWSNGFPYWSETFLEAASAAKEGRLLEAYRLSATGGGMGSWMDTPIATLPETRLLNKKLYEERRHALMYAINFC